MRYGLPIDRTRFLLWLIGALAICEVGRGARGLTSVLRDWVPLGLMLAAYDLTRGLADTLGMPVQRESLVRLESWLCGGRLPTLWLQERLAPFDGHLRWWEAVMTVLYLSHFVVSFVLLAALWVRWRPGFVAFRRRFLSLTALGLVTYMLVPAAPPWMAARDGLIDPVHRILVDALRTRGFRLSTALVDYGTAFANPVAALPSLHAGWAALVALCLCRHVRPWARPLLFLYPLAMGFMLVAAGEHYVIDILLGYAYAAAVMLAWRVWDRRSAAAETLP
ncbi:MAG: hypothetical protein QOJ19_3781 [Acidimicrobiia bacterium]|nr:hypothetical protein [Acidimicrobiia bacterium]